MATEKKPAAKKTATKKPAAKKTSAAKAKPKTTNAATRRPDNNLPPFKPLIIAMTDELLRMTEDLGMYAANLRALDRQRHNGVGLKRQGFIEAAFRLSTKFPQYFPHWLAQNRYALLS